MTVTTEPRTATLALGVSGWGVLSPYGLGADEFTAGLRAGRDGTVEAAKLTDDPVPDPRAYALAGFRARDHLGRKGTSFLDRRTAFAMLACGQALADSDLVVGDDNRDRIGVVLGTGVGSLQSTSDYSRDTLVQEKPYLVNPILFPNTVLNCAAGQAAIRHGLRGVNATLAGGPMATLAALRYAMTVLGRGRADALLVGAMEEYTPHMAWADHRAGDAPTTVGGEGGAVFLVEDAAAMRAAGRDPVVEIIAVDLGHTGGRTDLATALADRVRRVLDQTGVAPEELATVVTTGAAAEHDALDAAVGPDASRVAITDLVGNCPTAAGALQVAAVLAHHRGEPEHDDCLSLIVASTADGSVGAALLKGNARAARDHR
ncbi:beta-ketoacyl synthase N-terminal-like domain-containing protein [Micromonospora sp. NPDC048999]|uniref:beta-ketoacyl synthase N-terminal-like domain-containing protein n=1 Tax=Micromonospora sp. NPDC048999 TaxID=3155391 RepID=UPI003409FED6